MIQRFPRAPISRGSPARKVGPDVFLKSRVMKARSATENLLFCLDFCHGQVMWPPLSALQVKLAEPGHSCKQVCQEEQLICEPSFFQHLNKDTDLAR
ncbi:hypothetical protein CRUP_012174 [Coryphaenoides rupestris]|nr:hypothetical protein CRUP_012174 [Coryphaenoides rupestris]